MLADETTLRLLTNYALAHQPPTLQQVQQAERREQEARRRAAPPPEDPAAIERAVRNAAIIQMRDRGIRAGIAAGLAYGRVEARRRHVR